jgi:hypothetical protein
MHLVEASVGLGVHIKVHVLAMFKNKCMEYVGNLYGPCVVYVKLVGSMYGTCVNYVEMLCLQIVGIHLCGIALFCVAKCC